MMGVGSAKDDIGCPNPLNPPTPLQFDHSNFCLNLLLLFIVSCYKCPETNFEYVLYSIIYILEMMWPMAPLF